VVEPDTHPDKVWERKQRLTEKTGVYRGNDCGLGSKAQLASWPTPMAGSPATDSYNEAGNNDSSRKTVALASWPTTQSRDGSHGGAQAKRAMGETRHGSNLDDFVKLTETASWATAPTQQDQARSGDAPGCSTASMAPWPTPVASLSPPAAWKEEVVWWKQSRAARNIEALASWATPSTRDHKDTSDPATWNCTEDRERRDQLPRQTYLVSGPTSSGSPAQTAKRGQLNPDFSRWLMGYGTEHLSCAPTATPSSLRSRRNSSKPSWK
jgi:hypothetical protein